MFPIPEIGKQENTHCPNDCSGCAIHDSKPELCRDFECAYFQSNTAPLDLRPDRCGVIFSRKNERIFSGVLVTGVPVTDTAKGQIQAFNEQGFSVVLVSVDEDRPLVAPVRGLSASEVMKEYAGALGGNI